MPKTLKEHDDLVTVRLPRPLKDWLRTQAEGEDLSLSEEIRSILDVWRDVEEQESGQDVSQTLSIRLPNDLRAWAERTAEDGGLELSNFLVWAIERVRKEWIEKGLVWRSRPTS